MYEVACDGCQLTVLEDKDYRWLQLGKGGIQSAMKLSSTWQPVLPYYPGLLSVLLFQKNPDKVLIFGLGGGELPRYFAHCMPATQITALEKNSEIIEVFQTWFNPDQIQIDIINDDVCNWHVDSGKQYDIIFLDVYNENSLPECLYGEDLYVRIYRRLTETGVLAANLVVKDEREAVLLLTRIRKVFNRQTLFLSVGGHMNLIVLAFRTMPESLNEQVLQERAEALQKKSGFSFKESIKNILNTKLDAN